MPRKRARPKARKEQQELKARIEEQKNPKRRRAMIRQPTPELSLDQMERMIGLWDRADALKRGGQTIIIRGE